MSEKENRMLHSFSWVAMSKHEMIPTKKPEMIIFGLSFIFRKKKSFKKNENHEALKLPLNTGCLSF
jgi:hypothetical protein